MSKLSLSISPAILEKFPDAKLACALIKIVVQDSKKIKNPQANYLSNLKQQVVKHLMDLGIDKTNYETLGVCKSWNKIFDLMQVHDGKKSTIINLLKRASNEIDKLKQEKKADLGKISNFVDFYNCLSINELTPMGAFDASQIEGDIILRFGQVGETFQGLGKSEIEQVKVSHVVYADDKSILTWLWNYRDASHVSVPIDSEGRSCYILLFADQAEEYNVKNFLERPGNIKAAMQAVEKEIGNIGGTVLSTYYLDKITPKMTMEVPND